MIHRHEELEDAFIEHVDYYLKVTEFSTSPQITKACKQPLASTTDHIFAIGPHRVYDDGHGFVIATGARNHVGGYVQSFIKSSPPVREGIIQSLEKMRDNINVHVFDTELATVSFLANQWPSKRSKKLLQSVQREAEAGIII